MKQKQLVVLLVLVVALGAVGYYLRYNQAKSISGNPVLGQKLFPISAH